jgi:hypothetical protein
MISYVYSGDIETSDRSLSILLAYGTDLGMIETERLGTSVPHNTTHFCTTKTVTDSKMQQENRSESDHTSVFWQP